MNESSPSGFCVNCGEPMSAETKFCVNCGAERVAAAPVDEVPSPPPPVAPTPTVPTPAVPTPTVPTPAVALPTVQQPRVAPLPSSSPPPAGSPRSPNRNRAILAGVIVGLVIAGAAGFAWAKSSDSDHKTSVAAPLPTSAPLTSPTTPTTPLPTEPPITFTPTTSVLDMRSVVSQLDATLTQSGVQVAQLKLVIDQYVSCGLPAGDAAVQLQPVVNGRRQIVNDLDQMLATTSGAGRELVILLRKAIDFSAASRHLLPGVDAEQLSHGRTRPLPT